MRLLQGMVLKKPYSCHFYAILARNLNNLKFVLKKSKLSQNV